MDPFRTAPGRQVALSVPLLFACDGCGARGDADVRLSAGSLFVDGFLLGAADDAAAHPDLRKQAVQSLSLSRCPHCREQPRENISRFLTPPLALVLFGLLLFLVAPSRWVASAAGGLSMGGMAFLAQRVRFWMRAEARVMFANLETRRAETHRAEPLPAPRVEASREPVFLG